MVAFPPEDEGVEAVGDSDFGEVLDPPGDGPVEHACGQPAGDGARDVEHPPQSPRRPTGGRGGIVEATGHLGDLADIAAEGGDPAVGGPGGELERPEAVDAQPDADRVGRDGPGLGASEPVVGALEAPVTLAAPHLADDGDGLIKRPERLTGTAAGAAVRLD